MKEKWDERYGEKQYAYGEQPNNYLKEQLSNVTPGKILFPAEGEGRNAVYAATLGWKVFAFDQSIEGNKKAVQLASKNNVEVDYKVGEFQSIKYPPNEFDAIGLIYAHFPANNKSEYHKILTTYLRPGGIIIFEAFSKNHLTHVAQNPNVGGPRDLETLFSIEEVKSDFSNFEIIELTETEIELHEGRYHNGKGSVIRFVGRKKN